jgi:Polyketide cyclase / dehydrase and lipid transport
MWYMQPVSVRVEVPQPRELVFDFLDVMANHEQFTDHMLRDWEYSGPPTGVGSKARVKVTVAGQTDTIDMEVVDAERPAKIVEQNVGAGGRRRAHGTYTLVGLPSGGTRIEFEYRWLEAPLIERLFAPVARGVLRRGNQRAMERLAEMLAARPQTPAGETQTPAGETRPPAG